MIFTFHFTASTREGRSKGGYRDGWTRATFILRKHDLEELKALAYWERKTIKEVIDEALVAYLRGKRVKPVTVREEEIR